MIKPTNKVATVLLVGFWQVSGWGAVSESQGQLRNMEKARDPSLKVQLLANVQEVQPGIPFELAIKFDIEKKWHIYWKNSGDSGLPPMVNWQLPEGFSISPLRYPVPHSHKGAAGLVTNILKGQTLLTTLVTTPKNLKVGSKVKIQSSIRVLMCKDLCIQQQRQVDIELPVGEPGAATKPANKDIFAAAYSAFPKPFSEAKYLKITPEVDVDQVRAEDKFNLSLVLEIDKGFYIQSGKPLKRSLTATEVFLENTEGIDFEEAVYPEPVKQAAADGMQGSKYEGRIEITFKAQVDKTLSPGPLRIAGVLTYQIGSDQGQTLPAESVEWELKLPVKSAEAVPADGATPSPTSGTTQSESSLPPNSKAGVGETEEEKMGGFLGRFGITGLLIGCFVYGLFLNATPCVLPLLSIKILGFVQQAHESRRRTLALGLVFGIGVIMFFMVLGFLAAAGNNLLQYPVVVIGLGAVVMALSLSMLGVYTLQVPTGASKIEATMQQEGLLSSFGKGALAPILGFACTGPLLAGAFGYATQLEPHIAVFAFLFAGLGMAFPYMLLGANPGWLSFVPKPGLWMVTFERIMGFLLLGMVIWLLHPLVSQIGAQGFEWTLVFLVVIAMACWVLGKIEMTMSTVLRWRYRGSAIVLIIGGGFLIYGLIYPIDEAQARQRDQRGNSYVQGDWTYGIPWRTWSANSVEKEVLDGKTVLVDFTAAWCTVCKQNKALVLNKRNVRNKMQSYGVIPFQGDYRGAAEDPEILAMLKKYRRLGVPLNLIYPAGKPDEPIKLRPTLTIGYFLENLEKAGPSQSRASENSEPGTLPGD